MKLLMALGAATIALSGSAFALGSDFVFKAEKKRTSAERTQSVSTSTTEEHWAYHVTITNHAFKDLANVEVRYIFYSKTDVAGSASGQAKEAHKTGSKKIDNFKANANFEFDTAEAELTKSQLVGGYQWANGAKARARASLSGIWIRIYQDGKMLAEFSDPDGLKAKEKWTER